MTRDAASFEKLYVDLGDPWSYETSTYEADKYRRTLALLPPRRYRRGLEVGCSIGVMSKLLAERCDHLLGLDFAPTAIAKARERGISNARFEVASVPRDWPAGRWDLIVVSELLYYLNGDDLEETITRILGSLAPDGDCLVVGYLGETETAISSREAGERFLYRLRECRPDHRIISANDDRWEAFVASFAQATVGHP